MEAETAAVEAPSATDQIASALEGMGMFKDIANDTSAPEEEQVPANTNAGEEVDPLEALDLSTPEGIAKAREVIAQEKKKANVLRQKAQNAHAAAEAREAKFKKTKQDTLSDKQAIRAREAMFNAAVQDMQKGDPEAFLKGVAALSNAPDVHKFWRDISIKLASGGTFQEPEPAKVDPATQARLDQLEAHIREQGRAVTETKIAELRHQQLQFAQTSQAHPFVSAYSIDNPQLIDQALTQFRQQEFDRLGRPISVEEACTRLEQELSAQFELLQRANSSVRGLTGERGATGLGPDRGRETSATAKTGMPQRQAQTPQSPISIPASLSAAPAASRRPTTAKEEREAIANVLPDSFFASLGYRG